MVEEEGDETGQSTKLAASVWYELRNSGHLRDDIDIVFTRVQPRPHLTVDNVIECTYATIIYRGKFAILRRTFENLPNFTVNLRRELAKFIEISRAIYRLFLLCVILQIH